MCLGRLREKSERTMQRQGITYKEILVTLKKGLRNRNWRGLNLLDKAWEQFDDEN